MTIEELKASVLRGCALSGQAWGVTSVADADAVSPADLESAIQAEIDAVLFALAGSLALRRDARFIAQARTLLVESAAAAARQTLEAARVTVH